MKVIGTIIASACVTIGCIGGAPDDTNGKPEPAQVRQEAYLFEQAQEFDWSKLRVDPKPFLGKTVTVEGWLGITWGAGMQVAEVFIYETPESLRYALNRRSIQVDSSHFLEAIKTSGIKSESLAAMLSGKCVEIEATLAPTGPPFILGLLEGKVKVKLVRENTSEMLGNF